MAATRWTGKGDGSTWSDPANWGAGVPSAGIDAAFGPGAIGTVHLAGRSSPLSAGALLLQADSLILARGVLNLAPTPSESGNTDDIVLSHGAHLTVAASARVQGSAVAEIGEGTGATLTVLGVVAEEFGVALGGTLDVRGPKGHWLSGDSGLFLQDSALVVEKGAHVDTGGKLAQYPAAALFLDGNSTGLVTGAGSTVRLANVFVSQTYGTGSLTVRDGGRVFTGGSTIGGDGDGTLTVRGVGSLFSADRGLRVGGQVPVNSKMVVENGGTVRIGDLGLVLDGTLSLDASARFSSPSIISGGGTIDALAGPVVLSSDLLLSDNDSAPYETGTTSLIAAPGATLTLTGAIGGVYPGDGSETLDAGAGHIVLAHANASFVGETAIYGATLEIAAADAAGTGRLAFVGGGTPATLQIDGNLPLHNVIGGFGAADTIDLRGVHDTPSLHDTWTANTAGTGGTLTVMAGSANAALTFADGFTAGSFTLSSDRNGGTMIHLATHPTG